QLSLPSGIRRYRRRIRRSGQVPALPSCARRVSKEEGVGKTRRVALALQQIVTRGMAFTAMTDGVQLSWQSFEANYLGGPPREVVLPGASKIRLFVASHGSAFGMRVPIKAGWKVPFSPIRSITIREARYGGASTAELCCEPGAGSKEFFYFLLAIADGIQLRGLEFGDAFEEAVIRWRNLLRALPRMQEEEELGLLGELFTLDLLVGRLGPVAVDHWTGPTTDKHDFRVRRSEFEVKTTAGADRIHVINGLGQLEPSRKCELYIISWQLERAGPDSGETLPDRIAAVRRSLKAKPTAVSRFDELLENGTSWRDADAHLYFERWRPRNPARVVPVDLSCPRITSQILSSGLRIE